MKCKNHLYTAAVFLLMLSTISCKKWIEVSPRTQIEDLEFFNNEQGFKEALNGVYLSMGRPSQYGRELTFGLSDVLGGMYVLSSSNGSLAYRDARAGLYTNAATQTIINGIWSNQYNSIANLNKLIAELETVDTTIFQKNNYRIIKGEAYGLRAFLHFDLLRIFGTSVLEGGADKPAIPYVTSYNASVSPKITHNEVVNKILADLTKSLDLLKTDPIYTGQVITADMDNGYLMDRKLRFNYYAARALEARVYLWTGNTAKALPAAEEIIAVSSVRFPWITQANISTSNEAARDRVFTTEHIFGLYVNDIAVNYKDILDSSRFGSMLVIDANRISQQFETSSVGSSDYRRVYLLREGIQTPNGVRSFFGKLYQPNGMTVAYAKKVPLIRIPEMYYIAAECLKESDPAKAAEYLNVVRSSRGISVTIPGSYTAPQIQDEIRKEYWKEFPLEGQMFYYYKRLNSTSIPGVTGTFPTARYVLPLPPDELEFGL